MAKARMRFSISRFHRFAMFNSLPLVLITICCWSSGASLALTGNKEQEISTVGQY
jgi:hypothetical protein